MPRDGPQRRDDAAWSDAKIIERMRCGDPDGIEALLRQHGPRLKSTLRLAFGLRWRDAGSDDLLEEAVHEAAWLLWRRARRLDPTNNLGGYYFVVARNELGRLLKAATGLPISGQALDQLPDDRGVEVPPPSPFLLGLRELIEQLPALQRAVLAYDVAANFRMPAEQVAREVGITRASVYTLRNRTKNQIDAYLQASRRRGAPDATP